jgi:cytochrome c556
MVGVHRRTAAIIGLACLAVGALASSAPGQDQSAATAKDVIFARKTVMSSLSDAMDRIETMLESGKINLAAGNADADTISVFLMAFPHLFPPSSNQWKPNADLDPATDTFASPDVWTKYSDFYQQSASAAKAADEARQATNDAEFKAAIGKLRLGCNGCHALYLKAQ